MSTPWIYPQDRVPTDGDTVWITRLPYFDKPFLANYDAPDGGFMVTFSDATFMIIPTWQVWKWRPV